MIKKIEINDLEQLVPLFDQYMVFYGKESDPEKYRAYLRDRIDNSEATVFLAYDAEKKPVGFVLNYHSFSSVSLGAIIVLNDLYVTESSRGNGIGRSLIEHTFNLAKTVGAVRVDLGTAKTNTAAQALYESIGFAKDSEFYAYSYPIK